MAGLGSTGSKTAAFPGVFALYGRLPDRQDEPSLTTSYNHCKQIVENFLELSYTPKMRPTARKNSVKRGLSPRS
jgi:hypothetical protein